TITTRAPSTASAGLRASMSMAPRFFARCTVLRVRAVPMTCVSGRFARLRPRPIEPPMRPRPMIAMRSIETPLRLVRCLQDRAEAYGYLNEAQRRIFEAMMLRDQQHGI